MAQVDSLDIQISASADSAVKSIDKVIEQIEELKKVLTFDANKNGINNQVQALETLDETAKIVSQSMKSVKDSIKGVSDSVSPQIQKLANTFTRIATAGDKSEQAAKSLPKIGNALNKVTADMANAKNIDSSINRFTSSIARLASAGDKSAVVAKELPKVGNALKDVAEKMAKVEQISDSTNSFTQAIAQLASAGDKAGKTAAGLDQLADGTLRFFNAMKGAPQISENTIRMTQAMAQLSATGGRVSASMKPTNTAFQSVSKSLNSLSNVAKKASDTIKKAMSGIAKVVSGAFSKISQIGIKASNAMKRVAGDMAAAFARITHSSRGLNTASSNLKGLLKTILGFKGLQALGRFGKNALELGSDITEVENVVDTAFGSMAGHAYAFASTAKEQFGLSELAAKQYSGTMMAMLKSSGVAQKQAAIMSTTLAGLAGDIASFYNIETDEAFYKLRSAISGETEPMKQLGVNMNIVNLEAFAMSKGITKAYKDMTLAEQATLRYEYILAKTTDAQGDFAKTVGTYANQLRLFKLNVQSISAVIGQGLIAAILPAIKWLNALMSKLMDVAKAFRNFMYTITGFQPDKSGGGIVDDMAGIGDAADDLGDLGDAAEDAGKKIKKNLLLLPFDELNVLSEASSDIADDLEGIGDIDTGIGDIGDFDKFDDSAVNEWAKKLRDAFLNQDWEGLGRIIAELINKGLEWLYKKIKQITPKIEQALKNLAKVINSFIKNLDWDLLGRTIGAGINLLTKAFNALFGDDGINLELLGKKLSVGLRGMIDEVDWRELGNAIGNYLMIAWRIAYGFIEDMWRIDPNTLLTGWAEAGNAIGDTLVGIFERIDFEKISAVLTEGFKGALETITYALNRFSENLDWIVGKINLGLDRLYAGLKWDSTAGQDMGQKIIALTDAISTAFNNLLDLDFGKVGQIIGAGITDIVRAFNQLTDIDTGGMDFEKLGAKLSNGLRKLVTEIPWEEFGNALGNGFMLSWRILDGFLNDMAKKSGAGLTGWQELGNGITDAINGLFDKFDLSKIASTISRLVNGIFETLKHAVENIHWDDIADNISSGLNTLISGIEWKENGKAFNQLMEKLLGMLLKAAQDTDWEGLGRGIGEVLSQIDWGKHLETVAKIIMEVLGGLLEGLGETPAGKVVAGLVKAFLALKLVSLLAPIASPIANALGKIFESKAIESSVQKGMEKALENSVGGVKISPALSGSLSKLGTAMADIALVALAAYIGLKLAEYVKPAIDEMRDSLGYNPIETDAISEEYKGIGGSLKLLKDQTIGRLSAQLQGLPNAATNSVQSMDALEKAMKAIGKGTIYTDKQLEKMQNIWGLTAEDVEMLRQAMLDTNPVLREVADTMGMYDNSAESIKNAAVQMGLMKDSAFDLKDLGNRLSDFVITEWPKKFFGDAKIAFENKDWGALGFNIVAGIVSGVMGAIMAPFEAAADLFGWIWDSICKVFGIHSPAENMKPLGRYIFLGIIEGFKENFSAFGEAISDWWNNHVMPWFTKERWVELYDTIRISFDEVWGKLRALWQNSNFSEWIDNHVTPWFTKEKWLEIYDSFKTSFEEKWNGLREWWSNTTFAEWIDNYVTPWFNKETWLETYDSFRSSFEEKWAELQAWWGNTNFSEWIDNYVKPFFDLETWRETYNSVKQGLVDKWEELRAWWSKTTFKEWIDDHVKPWFTKEKWSDIYKNVKDSMSDTWDKMVGWWNQSGAKQWIDNDVKPWFTLDKWLETYDSVKTGLTETWEKLRQWWSTTNFSEWIDGHVKPYFQKDTWLEIYDTFRAGLVEKWDELRSWWKSTDFSEWIDNHVKPQFTLDKWKGYYDAVKSGFESKWNDLTNWWENDGMKKFYDEHVKKWFSKETWTWDGIKEGLGESFSSAFEWIKELWNGFAIPINSLLKFDIPPVRIMGKEIFGGASINLGQLPTFATGGFPEDGLFMANHGELVGKFSNGRTAVANNEQIIAGIEEAAYRGFLRAQAETSPYLADIAENTRRTAEKEPPQLVLEGRETVEWLREWDDRSGYNMRI